jgi:hypothetical protein
MAAFVGRILRFFNGRPGTASPSLFERNCELRFVDRLKH